MLTLTLACFSKWEKLVHLRGQSISERSVSRDQKSLLTPELAEATKQDNLARVFGSCSI